jgi:hypothetical protein
VLCKSRLRGSAACVLNLKFNSIRQLPQSLWTLTGLVELHISGDSLEEVSPEIGQLTALQCLSVDINKLITAGNTSGPAMALKSLRNLTELQRLAISCFLERPLQELPVGNWVKMQYLRLINLFKVREFPEQLWRCGSLTSFASSSTRWPRLRVDCCMRGWGRSRGSRV